MMKSMIDLKSKKGDRSQSSNDVNDMLVSGSTLTQSVIEDQTNDGPDKKGMPESSMTPRSKSISMNMFKSSFAQKHLLNNDNINTENLDLVQKQDWQQRPYCQICFEKFTRLFRPHHCRMCGRSCCYNGSAKRALS